MGTAFKMQQITERNNITSKFKNNTYSKRLPTTWLKKYHRPDWHKRSPIQDPFCRYGVYYSKNADVPGNKMPITH